MMFSSPQRDTGRTVGRGGFGANHSSELVADCARGPSRQMDNLAVVGSQAGTRLQADEDECGEGMWEILRPKVGFKSFSMKRCSLSC